MILINLLTKLKLTKSSNSYTMNFIFHIHELHLYIDEHCSLNRCIHLPFNKHLSRLNNSLVREGQNSELIIINWSNY